MIEEWKIVYVNGEATKYSVSNLGRLRNDKNFMSVHVTGNVYRSITLRFNKKSIATRLHRIVAECFIPNPNNLPQVNHINGIKGDNRAINLEWCTAKQNIIHSFDNGLCVRPKGKESHLYDNGTKVIDLNTGKIYPSVATAARELKIPRTTISAEIFGYRPNKYNLKRL